MIGRSWSFIFKNNPGRLAAYAAAFAAYVGWTTFPGIIHMPVPKALAQRVAPDEYWLGFLPLAQFAAAACIAYLALEFFRHTRVVTQAVEEFLAPTGEERRTLAAIVDAIRYAEGAEYRDLLIIVRLFDLCQARKAWVHRLTKVTIGGAEVGRREALRRARQSALEIGWFHDGVGRRFMKDFLPGGDMVVVAAALAVALWVHIMATVESFMPVYIPAFMAEPVWCLIQTAVLVTLGVGAPLFYVGAGRSLLDQLREVQDKANEQFQAKKATLDKSDKEFLAEKDSVLRADAEATKRRLPVVQASSGNGSKTSNGSRRRS